MTKFGLSSFILTETLQRKYLWHREFFSCFNLIITQGRQKCIMRHSYVYFLSFYGHAHKLGVEFQGKTSWHMTETGHSTQHVIHIDLQPRHRHQDVSTQSTDNVISARTFTALRLGFRNHRFNHCYSAAIDTIEPP
jgi:hypothetical protein